MGEYYSVHRGFLSVCVFNIKIFKHIIEVCKLLNRKIYGTNLLHLRPQIIVNIFSTYGT